MIPKHTPFGLTNNELKYRTGFSSLKDLMGYLIVVTDGNFDSLSNKSSYCTWFEEWMMFFELLRGNVTLTMKGLTFIYGISLKTVKNIIGEKI